MLSICVRCLRTRLILPPSNRKITCSTIRFAASVGASKQSSEYTYSDSSSESSDSDGYTTDNSGVEGIHRNYPGHIPTTLLQKALLGFGSAAVAINNPRRADMVSTMGETTGYFALLYMRKKMMDDPIGRQILEDRPRINTDSVDLEYLRSLPEETFGNTYVTWLDTNRASPDKRDPVRFVDDPDLAYVMQRYRETHDLYHSVLGMPTTLLGEIIVKWIEALQLGLPMCVLGSLFAPFRLGPQHKKLFRETHLPWAIRTGLSARFLMNVYYEKHWEMPLEELQQEMNIESPPSSPPKVNFTW